MTGILMLDSLTRGNTLKQGDKTPLTYKLLDADGDNLNVAGKTAVARLVHSNYLTIGYEKSGLTVASDDTVTFTIDKLIPARKYHVEIIVDNKFVFPSRSVESKFTIDKSSLGTDANIIEIVGKEALIRTVKSQVDTELQPLVTSMESARQAEAQRVLAENERSEKYESYAQQFNDVILDLSEEKDYNSLPEISAARGGHETLGNRLDDTDAQLAQTDVTHQQTETVKSLPVGSKGGSVKDFEYKGQTLVNLLKNGDFSDGWTGWEQASTRVTIDNGYATIDTAGGFDFYQNMEISKGKYYLSVRGYSDTEGTLLYRFQDVRANPSMTRNMGSKTYTSEEVSYSLITEVTEEGLGVFNIIRMGTGGVVNITDLQLINLTQIFGAGNEPTKEEMDAMIDGYIDGMHSAKMDVKTVGKNLWNDDDAYGAAGDVNRIPNGFRMGPNSHLRLLLPVNAGSRYSISAKTTNPDNSTWSLRMRDINNILFASGGKEGYRVNDDKVIFEIYNHNAAGTVDFTDIQLEESTTATEYEPYKSSTITLTEEPTLHRLPNGVADRVFEQDGQLWLERNVKEHVLVDGDLYLMNRGWTEVDTVQVHLSDAINLGSHSQRTGRVLVEGYPEHVGAISTPNAIGKHIERYISDSENVLYFVQSKGYWSGGIEEARADLAGTKILYQLAEPELINLTEQGLVTGELMSYANGTSYNNGSLKGEVSFKVPASTGAQITSLVGSSERQAKQITVLSDHVAQLISGV